MVSQFDPEEVDFLARTLHGVIGYLKDNEEGIKQEITSKESEKTVG